MKRCLLTETPRHGSPVTVRSQHNWPNAGWRCQRPTFSCEGSLLGRGITNWWAWNLAGGPSPQVYARWWCSAMIPVGPRTVMDGSKILITPPRIGMVDQPAGRMLPDCVLGVTRSKKTPAGHTKQHPNTFR